MAAAVSHGLPNGHTNEGNSSMQVPGQFEKLIDLIAARGGGYDLLFVA
jgi:hypothetical protein